GAGRAHAAGHAGHAGAVPVRDQRADVLGRLGAAGRLSGDRFRRRTDRFADLFALGRADRLSPAEPVPSEVAARHAAGRRRWTPRYGPPAGPPAFAGAPGPAPP